MYGPILSMHGYSIIIIVLSGGSSTWVGKGGFQTFLISPMADERVYIASEAILSCYFCSLSTEPAH